MPSFEDDARRLDAEVKRLKVEITRLVDWNDQLDAKACNALELAAFWREACDANLAMIHLLRARGFTYSESDLNDRTRQLFNRADAMRAS